MKDEKKTKKQLVKEIAALRRNLAELEEAKSKHAQIEKKLRESEKRYRSFFKTSKDCVFITSKDGRWIDMNDAAVELFGYNSRTGLQKATIPDLYANPEDRPAHIRLIEESGYMEEHPVDLRKKDGSIIHTLITSIPIKDEKGNSVGFQGTIRDITKWKQAEEERRRTERLLKDTQKITKVGGWEYDVADKAVFWTDGVYRIYGVNKEDYDPNDIQKDIAFYAPEHQKIIEQAFANALNKGEAYDLELRFVSAQGENLWVRTIGRPILEDGRVKKVFGNIMDITEHKEIEEACRKNEERFRELAEMLPEAVFETDIKLTFTFANQRAFSLTGYSSEDCKGGLNGLDMIVPEDRERALKNMERRLQGWDVGAVEYMGLKKDGTTYPLLMHMSPIVYQGSTTGFRGVIVDITERKQFEEALRGSERFLRDAFDAIQDGLSVLDPDFNITHFNKWIERAHYDAMPIIGKKCYEVYRRRESPCPQCPAAQAFLTGEVHIEEIQVPYADGSFWWCELSAYPIKDEEANVTGVIEHVKDITEKKRAKVAHRDSEEKYRILVDEAPLAVSLIGKDGRYKYLNPKFTEMFGYTPEDIPTGREWFRKSYPDKEYRKEVIAAWIDDQKVYGIGEARPRTFEVTCKDGTKKIISFKPAIMESGNQLVIYEDLTEKKRLEEQLYQSQKMEAIGRLAGGVAHDFNNLLTTIMGNAEMALMDLGREEPLYGVMEEVRSAGDKASSLTRQLLAFSRRQILQPVVLDPNRLLQGIDKMLRRLIGEDIELDMIRGSELGMVEADPGQLEQVIMNLAVNARDAMPEGGKLIIETGNVDLDEAYSEGHGRLVTPGPYVMLAVSDTGKGMSPEIQAQVFDPFFTTKEKGKGTGLGLSTVYGIMKQSKGYIWVYSEPGVGTSFKLYLPRVEKEGRGSEKGKLKSVDLQGSETVLVVEDDAAVRDIALKSLNRYGYRVLTARDGEEALRVMEEHRGEVHLVLTDVVMPGMSGKKTVEEIKRLEPGIRVLYMSGYTDNAIVHHGVLEEGMHFVHKPFVPEGLARKVKEVLSL